MFPQSVQDLINQLSQLPDIGPRAATRLVFYLLNQNQNDLNKLSSLIKELKSKIRLCPQCFNIASVDDSLCSVCRNPKRDQTTVCVVENVLNILPIERTGQYQGVYHILGGLISPSENIGPDNLKIKELIKRIENNVILRSPRAILSTSLRINSESRRKQPSQSSAGSFGLRPQNDDIRIREIIFALSPTTEGDTTLLFIERLLKPLKIKTTRLGRGLSIGSDMEYVDENTLTNAFLNRK